MQRLRQVIEGGAWIVFLLMWAMMLSMPVVLIASSIFGLDWPLSIALVFGLVVTVMVVFGIRHAWDGGRAEHPDRRQDQA